MNARLIPPLAMFLLATGVAAATRWSAPDPLTIQTFPAVDEPSIDGSVARGRAFARDRMAACDAGTLRTVGLNSSGTDALEEPLSGLRTRGDDEVVARLKRVVHRGGHCDVIGAVTDAQHELTGMGAGSRIIITAVPEMGRRGARYAGCAGEPPTAIEFFDAIRHGGVPVDVTGLTTAQKAHWEKLTRAHGVESLVRPYVAGELVLPAACDASWLAPVWGLGDKLADWAIQKGLDAAFGWSGSTR